MSPTWKIEAITSLISIHLYLDKISGHQQMRIASLSSNHILKSLLEQHHSTYLTPHYLFLENLTSKQRHKEFSSGFQLVNIFSNCFSFNTVDCKSNNAKFAHLQKLDKIFKDFSWDTKTVVVISDASIKNNATTPIAHIHSGPNIIAKTIHHTVNITSTKAELFAIRCGINQVVQVTDAIHSVRCIFDSSSHSYQLQSITIAQDLRTFFEKNTYNSIKFWDCPSNTKWIIIQLLTKKQKDITSDQSSCVNCHGTSA